MLETETTTVRRFTLLRPTTVAGYVLLLLGAFSPPALAANRDARTWSLDRDRKLDPTEFANPPADARPVMLWFWYDTYMTEQLVEKQLDLMKGKGITRVSITTRGRGHEAYGKEWVALVEKTLRAAQKRGMKVWLYNEYRLAVGKVVTDGGEVMGKIYEPRPDLNSAVLRHGVAEINGGQVADLSRLLPRFATTDPELIGIRDGALTVTGGEAYLSNDDEQPADGRISFDLKVATGAGRMRNAGTNLGWILRGQNERSGYLLFLQTTSQDFPLTNLYCVGMRDGRIVSRKTWPIPEGIRPDASYRIENVLDGKQIQVSVGGKRVAQFEDALFGQGRFGLWCASPMRMAIDNLIIEGAPGQRRVFDFNDPGTSIPFAKELDRNSIVAVAAVPADDGLAGVKDLTRVAVERGGWNFGAKRWTVHCFTRQPYQKGLGQSLGDVLNPVVGARYVEILYGGLERSFGWALKEGVLEAVKDDEPINPAWPGFMPWSPGIEQRLQAYGRSPAQTLPALFGEYGREGRVRRGLFWRCYNEAWSEGWYAAQGKWCADHGIALLSNQPTDDATPGNFNGGGNYQLNNQHVQVPGHDNVFGHIMPGKRSLMPRYGASSAHIFGRKWTFLETFGGYGWWPSPETYKYAIGSMAVRGENLFELHGFWSNYAKTPENISFPPSFDPDNTWWPVMDRMVDWAGRVSLLNSGRPVRHTAVLIPQRAVECSRSTARRSPETVRIDAAFEQTVYALEDSQVDFDLVSECFFDRDLAMGLKAKLEDGQLLVGNGRYTTLIVAGAETMSLETIQTLREFVRRGGSVALVGADPREETWGRDREMVLELQSLTREGGSGRLLRCGSPDELPLLARRQRWRSAEFDADSQQIKVLRRRFANADAYLVFNESEKRYSGVARCAGKGTPELWDVDSGKVYGLEAGASKNGVSTVTLQLEPHQFVAIVFNSERSNVNLAKWEAHRKWEEAATRIPLDGDWTFAFDRPGQERRKVELGDWTTIDPRFTGAGSYECTFTIPADAMAQHRRWWIDLGKVKEWAEVEVNSRQAGPVLWAPYRLELTGFLQAGRNLLRIRVINTWENARGTPRESGLFGPVNVRGSK